MQYTDSITKNFLTGSGSFLNLTGNASSEINEGVGETRWNSYEDPTYIGFYFSFNPNTVADPNNQDLDYMPQGLFLGAKNPNTSGGTNIAGAAINPDNAKEHPDSAVSFLQRRGEYYRANMMKEFRDGMTYLASKTPWVFETVTGMADVWKFDPKVNFRAKDKKIIIECNESINMRLTYLVDLYRKAAFDAEYMRYMLPETQRYFSMDLIVTEIRTMGLPGGGLFEPATFLKFTFDYCEFDFLGESLPYLETLSTKAGEGAKVKIPIKIGRIRESNSYGLLGAVLQDTFSPLSRGNDFAKKNFTSITSVKDATGENVAKARNQIRGIKGGDYMYGPKKRLDNEEAFRSKNAPTPDFGFLGRLVTGAAAAVGSKVGAFVNKGLLGNVYGFSLSNVLNQVTGILNNPIAATQGIISNYAGTPAQAEKIATKVVLTSADVKLLQDIKDTISYIKDTDPSVNLDAITFGDFAAYVKNSSPSQNLQGTNNNAGLIPPTPASLTGNLGKEDLTAPSIMNTTLGKILFDNNGSSLTGNPGKVNLG